MNISAYFETRVWKNGEAEKVTRLQRYWSVQRKRVSRALERKERTVK